MKPEAIIWDMDGTLIDSEPLHATALSEAMETAGLTPIPDLHDRVVGMSADAVYRWLCDKHGLALPFNDWIKMKYDRYLGRVGNLLPMPGAMEFWQAAASAGLSQAVASNSDRLIVDANLRHIGLARAGLVSIARNDVRQGKPDPEIYLRAAYLLDVNPGEVVALEDSATGARAALAAGMRTFLVGPIHLPGAEGATHATGLSQVGEAIGL